MQHDQTLTRTFITMPDAE